MLERRTFHARDVSSQGVPLELFVVAGEELPDLLHHWLFVVDAVEHQGIGRGVAAEEAFV